MYSFLLSTDVVYIFGSCLCFLYSLQGGHHLFRKRGWRGVCHHAAQPDQPPQLHIAQLQEEENVLQKYEFWFWLELLIATKLRQWSWVCCLDELFFPPFQTNKEYCSHCMAGQLWLHEWTANTYDLSLCRIIVCMWERYPVNILTPLERFMMCLQNKHKL